MARTWMTRLRDAARAARAELSDRPALPPPPVPPPPPPIVDSMRESVITFGLDFAVVSWSPGAQGLYGWSAAEAIGKHVFDLIGAGMDEREEATFRARLLKKGHWKETCRRTHKDGSTVIAEVSYSVLRDGAGTPTGVLGVARDVTSAMEADREHRLLAALVRHMQEAVIVTDPQLRITEYLGAAEQVFGWSRAEAVGKNVRTDFVTEYPRGDGDQIRARMAAGDDARTLVRALRKDGSWIHLDHAVGAIRDDEGRITAYFSISRDVSQHVEDDRALWEHREAQLSHGLCPDCFRERHGGE